MSQQAIVDAILAANEATKSKGTQPGMLALLIAAAVLAGTMLDNLLSNIDGDRAEIVSTVERLETKVDQISERVASIETHLEFSDRAARPNTDAALVEVLGKLAERLEPPK